MDAMEVRTISRDRENTRQKRPERKPVTEKPIAVSIQSGQELNFRHARDAPVQQKVHGRTQYQNRMRSTTDDTQPMTDTEPEADSRTNAAEPKHTMNQHGNEHQQQFYETAKADEHPLPSLVEEQQRPSKLTFTKDEIPPISGGKKLTQVQQKADRLEGKLERAKGHLPSYRKLRIESTSGSGSGNMVRRLNFEKEVKPQSAHMKGTLPLRPVKAGANIAGGVIHRRVYQAEEENVGTKAAHRTEMVGEAGMRSAYHMHKTAPYRKVSKLQKKVTSANARVAYQKTLHDNPKLKRSLLSRMYQKQKLKRQYAKAAREAKRVGQTAKKTAVTSEKIATKVVLFVKRHPIAFGIIALILMVFFMIASIFSSCANMSAGGISGFVASTYMANDQDLNNSELFYTEWETDLQIQVDNAELIYPGYDEYRYDVDTVGHDPYALMAFLTAAYQNFTYSNVQDVLQEIFEAQYSLTFTEETETRTRTETQINPDTGEEIETEVEYEHQILHVTLTSEDFDRLVEERMTNDQKNLFDILKETKGNRQYVRNVFDFGWLPYMSSYYGYRVHPISKIKNYHTGVDIGAEEGTEICAGHDGKVTLAGEAGGYGLCVVLEGVTSGEHILTTKYGHCSELLVSVDQEVKAGDVIAKVGNTGNSTGPHLHLEVLVDNQYLNPLYFAATGG